MGKNIYYLSLLLCIVFVSNAMEDQIQELLSPAVKRDLAGEHSKQPAVPDSRYRGRRMLAMQTRQRLVYTPSGQEKEADWQLAVEGDTELHTAIREKNDDLLHVLLLHSQGAGINIRNARGDTPLLLVAKTGRSNPPAHILFRYPLDVNIRNTAGFPALYYATKNNDDGCMEMLLKHGADPKFVDEDGNTLLHAAAQSDAFYSADHLARYKLNPNQLNKYDLAPLHIAILKKFARTAYSIICLPDTNPNIPMAGESPLIYAIRNELLAIIRGLLGKGADVNAQDAMGNSALDLALTKRDNISIMSELLEHGANPDAKDTNGDTPLVRAIKNKDEYAVRALLEHGANPNIPDSNGIMPIFLVQCKDLYCVSSLYELLEHGAKPDDKDANGDTPLIRAIKNNDEDAVGALLQYKANPNIPDVNGVMPIFLVLQHKDLCGASPLYELLKHRAKPDVKDANGDTPLILAIRNKDILAVQALIESGTNPNIPDANGVMPVFLILQQLNDLHCAFCLVDHGANLYIRDAEGNTPLHLAVQFESLVSLMISRGAQIGAVNKRGDTPLHCVESITPRSAYVLRLYGADINLKNKEGLTPYEKAVRCRNIDGRLLRILEPGTTLASAEDYRITLAGLPDVQAQETRPVRFIESGKDSRIERVDDSDGQTAAAPEESRRVTDSIYIGDQTLTQLCKQAVAFFCPWARTTAKQSRDSAQPVSISEQAGVSPVAMTGGASAPSIGASPRGSTDAVVNFDAPGITQSGGIVHKRHPFLASGQP